MPAPPTPLGRSELPAIPVPVDTGRLGERAAATHLERRGLKILAQNLRTGAGEIDLIAADKATIVFAEVKTRRLRRASTTARAEAIRRLPETFERIGALQRHRLRGLALDWLRAQPRSLRANRSLRFDAIAVALDHRGRVLALEHIEAAW